MTMVTILRHHKVSGWPDKPDRPEGERAYVLPLGKALSRKYTSDAHMTQYASPIGRRLNRDALEHGVTPVMHAVVFDVDCPEVHGSPEPAPEEWRQALRAKMAALHDSHNDPYFYETRAGSRIIYTLPQPVPIDSVDAARRWSQCMAVARAYMLRRFDIDVDSACGDWQRLFRLPHATREPGGAPEDRLVVGDPDRIGALRIQASADDVEAARESSRAFDQRRVLSFAPCASGGEGVLAHLLRGRGDIVRQHSETGTYVIRCPNEQQHTGGRTGDTSTILYPPAAGTELGWICCQHQHCSAMRQPDWLRLFSQHELEVARRAAGIERPA